MIGLALIARVLSGPRWRIASRGPSPLSARRLALIGFGGSAILFLPAWATPSTDLLPGVALALLVLSALLAALLARRIVAHTLDRERQLALMGGALAWLALIDLALASARPDTAALVVIALVWLWWHQRRAPSPARAVPSEGRGV